MKTPSFEAWVVGIIFSAIAGMIVGIVLVQAQSQPKTGPWVGLRIPVYDNLKKGYWYFKLDANQFQATTDPAGTSDGILSLKDGFMAGGVRYQMPTVPPASDQPFGGGKVNEQILGCSAPVQGVSICAWR